MAHDWPKILALFEVMQLSSGYPNHKHIFDAANKELEDLEPPPKETKRGGSTEHGGAREPVAQPTPGPLAPPQQQSLTGGNRRV